MDKVTGGMTEILALYDKQAVQNGEFDLRQHRDAVLDAISMFSATQQAARALNHDIRDLQTEIIAAEAIEAKFRHLFVYLVIGGAFVFILVFGMLWFKVSRNLTREIEQRKAAEAVGAEQGERYTTLFNNMTVGVFYQRADGLLTDANRAALSIFDLTYDQFVGKHSNDSNWNAINEDGTPMGPDQYPQTRALKTGKIVHDGIAGVRNRKTGTEKWVSITAVPQFRPGDQAPWQVFVTMQDITQRKQFEIALKQSEQQIQNLHDQTEQLSLAAAQMISMEDSEQIYQKVSNAIVHYSDYQRVIISLFKAEFPFRDIVGFAGIEKENIDRVRGVEFKRSWYDGVFEKGITIGRFSYYIPHSMKHILNQEATYYGEGPEPDRVDAWHPEDNLFVRMNDEKGNFIGVISVDSSKSGDVPSARTIRPLEIFSSLISQIIIRKREQEKRESVEAQLQQAMKMESIGTLAGGIAHDFNNILGIILGNTELSLDELSKDHPAYESLSEIQDASLRAADIVKQLLSFSRKTEQRLGPIDIVPVIRDTLNFMRSSIPATVDIKPDIYMPEAIVMADPVQINRILMNLCINAFQAMPGEKGRINISVDEVVMTQTDVRIASGMTPGAYTRIKVSDNGAGIAPDLLSRIFDPYFTTKDVGKGSGMGLAVVVGIVKAHNGAIWVESCQGEGTRFTICLPLAASQPGPARKKGASDAGAGHERILFVDDDTALTDMYEKLLTRMGYQVTVFNDPEQACVLFCKNPDRFDLVITDMTMPDMTGADLAKSVMAVKKDIPVIVCTGHSDLIDDYSARELGIAALVTKPVTRSKMGTAIRSILK